MERAWVLVKTSSMPYSGPYLLFRWLEFFLLGFQQSYRFFIFLATLDTNVLFQDQIQINIVFMWNISLLSSDCDDSSLFPCLWPSYVPWVWIILRFGHCFVVLGWHYRCSERITGAFFHCCDKSNLREKEINLAHSLSVHHGGKSMVLSKAVAVAAFRFRSRMHCFCSQETKG